MLHVIHKFDATISMAAVPILHMPLGIRATISCKQLAARTVCIV